MRSEVLGNATSPIMPRIPINRARQHFELLEMKFQYFWFVSGISKSAVIDLDRCGQAHFCRWVIDLHNPSLGLVYMPISVLPIVDIMIYRLS